MTCGLGSLGCAEDGSQSRFANLGFRFDNKWSYTSEDITAIFLAAAAEEEEEQEEAALCGARWIGSGFCEFSFANKSTFVWKKTIDIRVEENLGFEGNMRSDYCCGTRLLFCAL
jgi:hypothetical protein